MKNRNIIIISLLVVGVALFGYVQGVLIPQMAQKEQQYESDQQDPLTHHIESVWEYKHKYMGNASNLMNLFYALPLSDLDRTYQLFPDQLTAEINYKVSADSVEKDRLESALLYNATVAFSLIENLEAIHFNFEEVSYRTTRTGIEAWYGVNLTGLAESDEWDQLVQINLADREYVEKGMTAAFSTE